MRFIITQSQLTLPFFKTNKKSKNTEKTSQNSIIEGVQMSPAILLIKHLTQFLF